LTCKRVSHVLAVRQPLAASCMCSVYMAYKRSTCKEKNQEQQMPPLLAYLRKTLTHAYGICLTWVPHTRPPVQKVAGTQLLTHCFPSSAHEVPFVQAPQEM
jgi:hypothetical protein